MVTETPARRDPGGDPDPGGWPPPVPAQRDGRWDFYADPAAVARYVRHRDAGRRRNSLVEEPEFRRLLGEVRGLRCLDLGCGFGHYSELLARAGAAEVLGVDRSDLMIAQAEARRGAGHPVTYRRADIDTLDLPDGGFDVVVSNLTFHYLADPGPLFGRVFGWLRPAGRFIFSVEHPIYTATRDGEAWCDGPAEPRRRWVVSDYFDESDRWGYFGRKYHHPVATWLSTPLAAGFELTAVAEPRPSRLHLYAEPDLAQDLHRPLYLIASWRKPEDGPGAA